MTFDCTYLHEVSTDWNVERFAEKVRNSRVNNDGSLSEADMNLHKYFPQAQFGDLSTPTTILDCHGNIQVWYLPGILHPMRLVSDEGLIRHLGLKLHVGGLPYGNNQDQKLLNSGT